MVKALILLLLCVIITTDSVVSFSMQSVPSTSVALSSSMSLVGRSRAGDGTTFVIPQLKWMFDCGALVDGGGLRQPRTIFLTHTHSDHIFTLAHFTHSRVAQQQQHPIQVYVPKRALSLIQNYLEAYAKMITMDLESGEDNASDSEQGLSHIDKKKATYELMGVEPGEEFSIRNGGKEFLIRVVECVHRVDCLGYSVFERQHTLKEEFRGLPGKDIGQLRKQGVEINEFSWEPFLCYLGDTTAQVFAKHPEILQEHSIIVVECSFLDDKSQDNAVRTKHMHWFDLKPIVDAHPTILFVLTHFSLRHAGIFLRTFFNEESTTSRNVHPMLVKEELQEEWEAHRTLGNPPGPPGCECFVCRPAKIQS